MHEGRILGEPGSRAWYSTRRVFERNPNNTRLVPYKSSCSPPLRPRCPRVYACLAACTCVRAREYARCVSTWRVYKGAGKRDTSRFGSIRLRASERRDWSRDGCIVSCRRCSADWLHPGTVDCTLRFRRVSNRTISPPASFSSPRSSSSWRSSRSAAALSLSGRVFHCCSHSSRQRLISATRPVSLGYPAVIDREKSHGGIIKAHREESGRLIPRIYESSTLFRVAGQGSL